VFAGELLITIIGGGVVRTRIRPGPGWCQRTKARHGDSNSAVVKGFSFGQTQKGVVLFFALLFQAKPLGREEIQYRNGSPNQGEPPP